MASTSALREDLEHPLAGTLLDFNLLPSRWLHPSRREYFLPPGGELPDALAESVLHRHWSASLLREIDPGDLVSLDDPAAPLCLASEPLFEDLVLHAGLLVLAPAIRRLIGRSEVADLGRQVGTKPVDFARHEARALRSGDGSPELSPGMCREQARRLGYALLSLALDTTQPALAVRARLRLPADAAAARSELPPDLTDARGALVACMAVLRYLEPEWPSSFPGHR